MQPVATEELRHDLYGALRSGGDLPARCSAPSRHPAFGHSTHGQRLLVHRVERVVIGWPESGVAVVGARWLCQAITGYATLHDESAVEGLVACAGCEVASVNGGRGRRIYFAERDGRIKIGSSTNVAQRMVALDASLLASMPGGVAAERRLHRRFADARIAGEWFRPTPELMSFIAEVPAVRQGVA